jgi:hypothetical protein
MNKNDWIIHEPTRDTFKIDRIWGKYVLVDNYVDSGDVHLLSECRKASDSEIRKELERRVNE